MLPNYRALAVGRGMRGLARVARLTLIVITLAAAIALALKSLGGRPATVRAADNRLEEAELEREGAAARAAVVVGRAAHARAATKPALARVESLRARVTVERAGQLRVQETGAVAATAVPVPPLVTERIQADSVAISALTLALTMDSSAAAAQDERLVAETKARDAARVTIAQLERQRNPRCGRRCGMVLGAATMVALGIAVDQTRRLW